MGKKGMMEVECWTPPPAEDSEEVYRKGKSLDDGLSGSTQTSSFRDGANGEYNHRKVNSYDGEDRESY